MIKRKGAVITGIIVTAFLMSVIVAVVRAADRYVATNALSSSPYNTWGDAASNIQDAVNVAALGETVWVSNGTYYLTNQISISVAITTTSVNGREVTIVDGGNSYRGFNITTTATLARFTVRNGYTNEGGGIKLKGGTVSNCIIANNVADGKAGGGIYSENSGAIYNCVIVSNIACAGAGVNLESGSRTINSFMGWNRTTGDATAGVYGGGGGRMATTGLIDNCAFTNNWGQYGGGVYLISAGTLSNSCFVGNTSWVYGGGVAALGASRVDNCTFKYNVTASNNGAGVACMGGSIISYCSFYGNSAPMYSGGGAYVSGLGIIQNCLFYSNNAVSGGGGVQINASTGGGTVRNCTIVSNYALNGGGISVQTLATGLVENTIVYFNYAPTYSNWYHAAGAATNIFYTNSCTFPTNDLLGSGNISNNPAFVNSGVTNCRLMASSPCIHAGINRDWMTNSYDLDGRARIRYGTVDMGAYEHIHDGTIYKLW